MKKRSIYRTLGLLKFTIKQTPEFEKWFSKQDRKTRLIVGDRISRIQEHGHLGNSRALGRGLFELKWKSGLRIYYTFSGKEIVLLLNGGTKHGQQKDIKKAKKLQEEYC